MRHTALSLQRSTSFPASMADVRGYEVRTRDRNEKVGKVGDLVCDPEGRLRYLDVTLGGIFNRKRVLLPVGLARADRSNDVLWVAAMTKEQVRELPEYDGNPDAITEDYERQCCSTFLDRAAAPLADAGSADAARDDADLYDQGRLYADRGGPEARDARVEFTREIRPAPREEERRI